MKTTKIISLIFLNLSSFKPATVDNERKKYFSEYFYLLRNIKEYFRMQPQMKEEPDKRTAINRLEFYVNFFEKYSNYDINSEYEIDDNLIWFIARYFHELYQVQLKNLPLPIIESIIKKQIFGD